MILKMKDHYMIISRPEIHGCDIDITEDMNILIHAVCKFQQSDTVFMNVN